MEELLVAVPSEAQPSGPWDVDYYKRNNLYFHLVEVNEVVAGSSRVQVTGHGEMLMFGSYSYLGLIGHPRVNAAAIDAVKRYGTGTNGVRLLAGTLPIHNQLEERIAELKGTQDAITFSSGYAANVSTISALVGRHDAVFCDKLDHASIVDGCRLSGAKLVRFNHNDVDDLDRRLALNADSAQKLVVVDGVYSMDGDVADLPGLRRVCDRHGALLMVDEAHALGVIGATGKGIEEHFNLPPATVDIKMGTLSKAIPSVGGYVASSRELVSTLKHQARAFIYSAALPPASAAASLAALNVMQEEPERVQRLQSNAAYMLRTLREAGFDLLQSETAIAPVICGSAEIAARLMMHCVAAGVFVQAVLPPVVPEGLARLRATVTANHNFEDIDNFVSVLSDGAKAGGLL